MHPAEQGAGDRATRGIDRLAPACPLWWAPGPSQIDLGTLDFLSAGHGILGQVFGSHEKGLQSLHVPPDLAIPFGFAALDAADNEELKAIWRVLVNSFRAETTAPYLQH